MKTSQDVPRTVWDVSLQIAAFEAGREEQIGSLGRDSEHFSAYSVILLLGVLTADAQRGSAVQLT